MKQSEKRQWQGLQSRLVAVEVELQAANETLGAIRNGEVDAVLINTPTGEIVYTLENADRPYRIIVEQMLEGAITLGCDGTLLYCNSSFSGLMGRPCEQLVGSSIFALFKEKPQLDWMIGESADGESAELSLLAQGGSIPVNLSMVDLVVEPGAPRMLCGIVTDLRSHYARKLELAEANARLAAEIAERTRAEHSLAIALEAADMGSWDLTLKTHVVARSARHDAIFGHEAAVANWTLETTLDHFLAEEREPVRAEFEKAVISGRVEFEHRIRRASDGAIRWLHVKGRSLHGEAGVEHIAGVVVDVTERRRIEEQLRQAQKMEAIGQLTGGIAHDFNNLLMVIGGSLEALSRKTALPENAQRLLEAARLGVARGATLNAQLLAFARRQDLHTEVFRISELLPNFATLLDRAVGEAVSVCLEPTEDLWSCSADPHQLEAAILNLAINARDAMPGGGRLVLATANASVTQEVAERWEGRPGDHVMVSVKDTGEGMSPDLIGRVFEPFFTTKAPGKGTGLGLSQVYGFAKQSGGFVGIDSAPGRGTTVSIYLPRSDAKPAAAARASSTKRSRRRDGTILLVEDDADVRAAAKAMLEALGYKVRAAVGGQAALDQLEQDAAVDLVFSDVIMSSGMTGVDLAHIVRTDYPRLPILLTSGYTAQRLVPASMSDDIGLIRKPYTMEQLAEAVHRSMSGGPIIKAGGPAGPLRRHQASRDATPPTRRPARDLEQGKSL